MRSLVLPHDYNRIRVVSSFEELVATPFRDGCNALCWPRTLSGNFAEVVELLGTGEGITPIEEHHLQALSVSAAGRAAVDVLLSDQRLLRNYGLAPSLDCIRAYPRDESDVVLATDVYSFHADSATVEADTYLCTYHGPATEGLRNDQAQRRVDIPETRAELLKLYGGEDDAAFRDYLQENCFDLHYVPIAPGESFNFGQGNLWRIAITYPGSPVPPCVHRAPECQLDQPSRLLLIS